MVLSFIGCIVLTTKGIAWVIRQFEGRPVALPVAPLPDVVSVSAEEDESLAAAIAIAIHKSRGKA